LPDGLHLRGHGLPDGLHLRGHGLPDGLHLRGRRLWLGHRTRQGLSDYRTAREHRNRSQRLRRGRSRKCGRSQSWRRRRAGIQRSVDLSSGEQRDGPGLSRARWLRWRCRGDAMGRCRRICSGWGGDWRSTRRALDGPHRICRRRAGGGRHTGTRCRSRWERRCRKSSLGSVSPGYAILIGRGCGGLRTGRHRGNEIANADQRHVGADRPSRRLGDPHDADEEGRMEEHRGNEGERDRIIRNASEPGAPVEGRVPPGSA
jgi:hypothetical protein